MVAKLIWKGDGLLFSGTAASGYIVDLASDLDEGRPGFGPMELMALGLAGCTGMDVLAILNKKRQKVTDFEVRVHTKNAETHPKVWTWVKIEYIFTGHGIESAAVERAIKLSDEKYCTAQNMIKQVVEIESEYKIIEA